MWSSWHPIMFLMSSKKTVSKVGCDMIILYVCNRIMVDYGRAAGLSWMVFLASA